MSKGNSVGSSARSFFKNRILEEHIKLLTNHVIGIGFDGSRHSRKFQLIDLTAGNACESSHKASPKILIRAANNAARHGCDARTLLIEQDPDTFDELKENLSNSRLHKRHRLETRCMDSRCFHYHNDIDSEAVVHVNCDANTMAQSPLRKEIVDRFTDRTSLFLTLGCNSGGAKKNLSTKCRSEGWRGVIQMLIDYSKR